MKLKTYQKAAAWAVIQALFAGCSAGGESTAGASATQAPSPATATLPTITSQPASISVAAGATATFTVVASGASVFYQWYRNGIPIGGASSASFTTPPLTAANNGDLYTVSAYSAAGNVVSAAAKVTITAAAPAPAPTPVPTPPAPAPTPAPPPPAPAPAPTPPAPAPTPSSPSITAQPVDANVITGATATFSVTATGTGDTYQWKKGGVAIAGATAASYTTPPVAYTDDSTTYAVVVTNSAGSATSATATLRLALSADQAIVEGFELAPNGGSYETDWELDPVGAQVSGIDYIDGDFGVLSASPLTNGPQTVTQSVSANMTRTLLLPISGPARYLKNGSFVMVPGSQYASAMSYVGSSIQFDQLATDGSVVYTRVRSGYSLQPLSGLLHAAPTLLQQPYNAIFGNAGVLDTTSSWLPGAAFMTYTERLKGDRYAAFDCQGATTTPTPAACITSATTLAAFMAAGFHSNSDNVTYLPGDGVFSTVGGVPMWVATNPRPASSVGNSTVEYRTYFQVGNSIYTGSLTRDGTELDANHWYTDPTNVAGTIQYLHYQTRLNKAAHDSLVLGMLI